MPFRSDDTRAGRRGLVKFNFHTKKNWMMFNIIQFKSGSIFQGETLDKKRHGYGQTKMKNGDVYTGNYLKDKRHGWGVYEYTNDEMIYYGFWENNIKHGHGILQFPDGVLIQGIFVEGTISDGEIIFPNDSRYVGSIENNLMHGYGTMTYSNGYQIVSHFYKDNLLYKNEEVCCYCLTKHCDGDCYEKMEGICTLST